MKHKKLSDILFKIGLALIAIGIIAGTAVGIFTADGFNLMPAIVVWFISLIIGTGVINISSSLSEAGEKKKNDEEMLKRIIEGVKSDENI